MKLFLPFTIKAKLTTMYFLIASIQIILGLPMVQVSVLTMILLLLIRALCHL